MPWYTCIVQVGKFMCAIERACMICMQTHTAGRKLPLIINFREIYRYYYVFGYLNGSAEYFSEVRMPKLMHSLVYIAYINMHTRFGQTIVGEYISNQFICSLLNLDSLHKQTEFRTL